MKSLLYAGAAVLATWAVFCEGGIFDLIEEVMR